MKKLLFIYLLAGCTLALYAQPALESALPLLQKNTRTPAQTQRVLTLLQTSKDPSTIFAAGAALVKIPPTGQHTALYSLVMHDDQPLKQTWAAIILTSMGQADAALSAPVEQALSGTDPALRAYGAAAQAFLTPAQTAYTDDIVRLYALDPTFAQRALNTLTQTDKQLLRFISKAAASPDVSTRGAAYAWLGDLHTAESTARIIKAAKAEQNAQAAAQVAVALAKNREQTLSTVTAGLNKNYKTQPANTYALALGLMTGNGVETIRTALNDKRQNVRINAARAAAYLASTLANPDAFAFSSDRHFDSYLAKSLTPQLTALAANGTDTEKPYVQNALAQLEKLVE